MTEKLKTNKIYRGDCIEVMQTFPDNCIDLVVTSPPYNIGINYDRHNDNMEWDKYYKWCEKWITLIYDKLKKDGRFCLNHYLSCGKSASRHSPLMDLNSASKRIGFNHHGLAVWTDRTLTKRTAWGSWLSASAPYINSPYEGILILYKDKWKKSGEGESDISKREFMEACSGVWNIKPETNGETPAPFPIKLPERCIKLLSYKGDIVLDPFVGGGTTCIAAKKLDRQYIGIELSENYCKIARKRLANVPSKKLEEWM